VYFFINPYLAPRINNHNEHPKEVWRCHSGSCIDIDYHQLIPCANQDYRFQCSPRMNESIRLTREQLDVELRSLPPSWPEQLIFVNSPTLQSPPYISAINPLVPNGGSCRLDENNPANHHFLRLQMWLAGKIDIYQILVTKDAQEITEELRHVALGLEDLKRKHWEALRRVHVLGMFILESPSSADPF
jgi:hypothetical protein